MANLIARFPEGYNISMSALVDGSFPEPIKAADPLSFMTSLNQFRVGVGTTRLLSNWTGRPVAVINDVNIGGRALVHKLECIFKYIRRRCRERGQ